MSANTIESLTEQPTEPTRSPVSSPARLWIPIALIACFWAANTVVGGLEKPYFVGFIYSMASAAVFVLAFSVWWWMNWRMPLRERLFGCALVIGVGLLIAPLCDKSILFALLTLGLPAVLTIWTLWMLLASYMHIQRNRLGWFLVVLPAWAFFALIRTDGVDADLKADVRWRWSPSAEDLFFAERANNGDLQPRTHSSGEKLALTSAPGDWPEFRGPNRDGVIRDVNIAKDWNAAPPRLVWKKRVGPAWSSVIVIGNYLFTQEQRGESESVVAYEATTGKELWVHEDPVRFWEAVAGAGPRATPTFANGRLYTLGGAGLLNCLDAGTGKRYWSRDVATDAPAKPPMWGFSGSPLVVDNLVIAFGGGDSNSLLAYKIESGEIAWRAATSHESYSSPQLATIKGKRQCLMLGDRGLTSVDPATGAVLWEGGTAMPGAPRAVQPRALDDSHLVVGTLDGTGVTSIAVTSDTGDWKVSQLWTTTQMKPEFPDFVVHDGHIYGFDGAIFCCLDLATGKRCWKEGRYGRGVVMLLPNQGLLLVVSETGEAVLLSANPERNQELGRFRALEGKTWNHPVIVRGRLYARNAEEMACYEVGER